MLVKKSLSTRFICSTSGAFAPIFAIAVLALFAVIGVAVDYSYMLNKKSKYGNYADAAVLAAAVSGKTEKSELEKVAMDTVSALSSEVLTTKLEKTDDGRISVQVTSQYKPLIMQVLGYKGGEISAIAGSLLPTGKKLNLALVLDTTTSMGKEGKIASLKSAATTLLNTVEKLDDGSGNAEVSLIPFAEYTRIEPADYKGVDWLREGKPYTRSWGVVNLSKSTGCTKTGINESAITVCSKPVYDTQTYTWVWEGCIGSRRDGYHKVPGYHGRKMEGFAFAPRGSCRNYTTTPMMELTDDFDLLKKNVNNLMIGGLTYIPSGLIWGWRSLDPEEPFKKGAEKASNSVNNVLVLLTDGSNSQYLSEKTQYNYPGYYHVLDEISVAKEKEAQVIADKLTSELCTLIKNDGIRIITVAFKVTDVKTKNMLTQCATSSDDYYNAENPAALETAFDKIGSGLIGDIRLTK